MIVRDDCEGVCQMNTLPTTTIAQPRLLSAEHLEAMELPDGAVPVSPGINLDRQASPHDQPLEVAIIDDRPLLCDCFGRSLAAVDPRLNLRYFVDVEAFEAAPAEQKAGVRVILMCMIWSKSRADVLLSQITRLKSADPSADVIVVSDIDDLDDVLKAIEHGMRGYIPTSDRLAVAVKAIQLVAAGGVYIPPSLLVWSGRLIKEMSQAPKQQPQAEDAFTTRQMAVLEAVRRGKANKMIAYELNMCESTVKVHIRNVMKKLKAKNRTELAFIFNNKMQQDLIVSKSQ
jgi:DNA-binding NarL/FixJ family response regulator